MIFGFRVVEGEKSHVDGLIAEWNELFDSPMRKIISDTKYYKYNNDTYLMRVSPMFPAWLWFAVWGIGAVAGFLLGWTTFGIVCTTILAFLMLFFIPQLYFAGTKHRLKKAKFKGKIEYLNPSECLKIYTQEVDESGTH